MKNFKKAMKNFKKVRLSLGMKIIALLSCVALLSMGFASWWIIKVDPVGYTQGSFTAYDVETKDLFIGNVTFTGSATDKDEIIFGKPATTNNTKWLVPAGEMDVQNLSVTFTVDVVLKNDDTGKTEDTNTAVGTILDVVTVTLTPSDADSLTSAISSGYLAAPTMTCTYDETDYTGTYTNGTISLPITMSTDTTTKGKVTLSITVEFKWGTAFGSTGSGDTLATTNTNPYDYFNGHANGADATNIAAAQSALAAINNLAGDTYEITFAATLGGN